MKNYRPTIKDAGTIERLEMFARNGGHFDRERNWQREREERELRRSERRAAKSRSRD